MSSSAAGGSSAMPASSSAVRIEAVAIVGNKNQRLFLASRASASSSGSSSQETLRLEYAAHCALDVIDERIQARAGGSDQQQGPPSTYLGLVLAIEDLSIYALITTTRLRILVVLRTPGGITATSSSSAGPASTGASTGTNVGGIATAHGASADVRLRDLDILTILRAIHTSYLAYTSNPFLTLGSTGAYTKGSTAAAAAAATTTTGPNSLDAALKGSFGHASASSRPGEIRSEMFDRRIRAIAGW